MAHASLRSEIEIPSEYICPITQEIMVDPVVAADSHTYERAAIVQWFQSHNRSPLTRQTLSAAQRDDLRVNLPLKNLIADFLRSQPRIQCKALLQADFEMAVKLYEEQLRQHDEKEAMRHGVDVDRVDSAAQGLKCLADKNFGLALEVFGRVLAREPANIDALLGRAQTFLEMQRRADALEDYRSVLASDPDHAIARQKVIELNDGATTKKSGFYGNLLGGKVAVTHDSYFKY